jgi:flagellar hook capping protein FlgD
MARTLKIWSAAAVAVALLTSGPARAQDETAGAPGEWLTRFTGARTLGLGGAYVALADDPLGILWNPAGLSSMDANEVRFENARLFGESTLNGIGFAVPGSRLPSFGVAVLSLRGAEYQRTNEMNDNLGTFHPSQTAYLLTVARAFTTRFALGINGKFAQQTVEAFNGVGFGLDLGATYIAPHGVRLGASIMNLGGPSITLRDTRETYPVTVRGGASLGLLGGRGLITVEVDRQQGLGTRLHGGGEYWIQNGIALRAGMDDNAATGGFSYAFAPRYQVDYAVADHPLGLSHRIGVRLRFGGFFAEPSADPQIFSPTGEKAVTRIDLRARTKAEPQDWTLELMDKSDQVVRRFGGRGQPPSHIEWDGKDENGLPLADGHYRYTLSVRDARGRVLRSEPRAIEIATTGPQGQVPVIPSQP